MCKLRLFKLFERMKSYFIWTFVVHTWNLKSVKHMWLWKNFENWMQLTIFHQKLLNREFGWLWKRWGSHPNSLLMYLWSAGLLNVKEKRMAICYIMSTCFRNNVERRKSKCCAVLIKHRQKGEQVITLQMA